MQHLLKFTRLAACLAALAFFASCDKNDDDVVSGTAKVSFTNASPDAPAMDVYIDNVKATASPLSYTATTGLLTDPYLTVNAGTRSVRIANSTTNFTQGNIPFGGNKVYSVFAFDTVSNTSTLKGLVLQDNLAAPAAGKAHVRFLHLSSDGGAIDIDLAKTNDTTKITNRVFLGNVNVDPSVSNFSAVNAGAYNINIRAAGTAPVLVSHSFTFAEGKIYTVYASGLKANGYGTPTGLNTSIIIHN